MKKKKTDMSSKRNSPSVLSDAMEIAEVEERPKLIASLSNCLLPLKSVGAVDAVEKDGNDIGDIISLRRASDGFEEHEEVL